MLSVSQLPGQWRAHAGDLHDANPRYAGYALGLHDAADELDRVFAQGVQAAVAASVPERSELELRELARTEIEVACLGVRPEVAERVEDAAVALLADLYATCAGHELTPDLLPGARLAQLVVEVLAGRDGGAA